MFSFEAPQNEKAGRNRQEDSRLTGPISTILENSFQIYQEVSSSSLPHIA